MAKISMSRDAINRRYEIFVDYYLQDFNASNAARKAGYACSTKAAASATGTRVLAHPYVKKLIKERTAESVTDREAIRKKVMDFWVEVANGDHADAKMADKLKATELLGKATAMFSENINLAVKDEIKLTIAVNGKIEREEDND